jgi:hypothetical protein
MILSQSTISNQGCHLAFLNAKSAKFSLFPLPEIKYLAMLPFFGILNVEEKRTALEESESSY